MLGAVLSCAAAALASGGRCKMQARVPAARGGGGGPSFVSLLELGAPF